ncbi:MAG: M48 family metallopeptidase [Candidatus Peribacteraceae bacterium]|jgi:predicted metal-dependent hydrolase
MGIHRRIRHRIERTRNRHSRAVFHNGTIVIRLARNLSNMEEQEHIENLLRRMTRQVLEDEQRIAINPFGPLLNGTQSSATVETATGKRYIFSLRAGSCTSTQRTARGWNIIVGPRLRRRGLHQILWKLLSDAELPRIERMVRQTNTQIFSARINSVCLKFASTQWGSCSPRKVIMINTALLFTSPSLLKYVVIHELAHLRYPNHSAAYWNLVEQMMPSCERARTLLKEYRLPNL